MRAKSRGMIAENISRVLEVIQAKRYSGRLHVERFEGRLHEEGEVYFQAGLPIYARAGNIAGQEALSWLSCWQKAYLSFSTDTSHPRKDALSSGTSSSPLTIDQRSSLFLSMPEPLAPRASYGRGTVKPAAQFPGIAWLVPQKKSIERDVLALSLTRLQRSVYLLVDGHRTVSDLARCVHRSIQEVEQLLTELQERGLVSL